MTAPSTVDPPQVIITHPTILTKPKVGTIPAVMAPEHATHGAKRTLHLERTGPTPSPTTLEGPPTSHHLIPTKDHINTVVAPKRAPSRNGRMLNHMKKIE